MGVKVVVQDDARGDEPYVIYKVDEDTGDVVDTAPERFADKKEADNYAAEVRKQLREQE